MSEVGDSEQKNDTPKATDAGGRISEIPIDGPTPFADTTSLSQHVHITPEQPTVVLKDRSQDRPESTFTLRAEGSGELQDGSRAESAQEGESPGGGENFQDTEARRDWTKANNELVLIIRQLEGLRDGDKAVVAELRADIGAAGRLAGEVGKLLKSQQPVPAGLIISLTLRIEMAQEAARDAEKHADGVLRGVLKEILGRLPLVGQKLLSMSLHLFPVKEWSFGGEVSALFVKGTVSVTFGR